MVARACLVAVLLASVACGGDSTKPSSPPSDVGGTWNGQIGASMSGAAIRFTWSATQSGGTASGPARLAKPAVGTEIPGTLTATITGDQAVLSFSAPPGSVPTLPACTASGSGSGTVGANSIFGTFTLTATGCAGIGVESASNAPLSMTR